MSADQAAEMDRGEEKKKQKRARKAFLAFLKRLRKACEVLQAADDWTEIADRLLSLVQDHSEVIPLANRQGLQSASQLSSATLTGVSSACDALQLEVEKLLKGPLNGSIFGSVVVGVAVTAILVVGAVRVYGTLGRMELVLRNEGCEPIALRGALPPALGNLADFVGLDLPDQLATDEEMSWQVPPVPMTILLDATTEDSIHVSALGLTLPAVQVSSRTRQVELDGLPVLGGRVFVDLGRGERHEIAVICR